jgi:hypothetical protein
VEPDLDAAWLSCLSSSAGDVDDPVKRPRALAEIVGEPTAMTRIATPRMEPLPGSFRRAAQRVRAYLSYMAPIALGTEFALGESPVSGRGDERVVPSPTANPDPSGDHEMKQW